MNKVNTQFKVGDLVRDKETGDLAIVIEAKHSALVRLKPVNPNIKDIGGRAGDWAINTYIEKVESKDE